MSMPCANSFGTRSPEYLKKMCLPPPPVHDSGVTGTVAETLFGILLIAGVKIRIASVLSGLLLLSFAIGMVTGLGIKKPFDYSVFSAAAAAFLLALWEPDRFTLDTLLNRLPH
jgi:uncharacterized membrane protein YphA (DoxX/SURF4 family)